MKEKRTVIYRGAAMLISGIAFVSLIQAGISFAGDAHEKSIANGSIRIQQEESSYPGLAEITMEQAKDIALANVRGDILKIALEDENGFLVYGVEIVTPEKSITEVKVDAGNGTVLLMEEDISDSGRQRGDLEDQDDGTDCDREDVDRAGSA